jgi:hypothetical protein
MAKKKKQTDGPVAPDEGEAWPVLTADEPLEGFFARYPGYKSHLENIQRAVRYGHIALMAMKDQATGIPTPVVVAIAPDQGGGTIYPLAKLFTANPYLELVPPVQQEVMQ